MRLICPNCDAEYEVDSSLIPPNGRDVQCSNCETTWFQPGRLTRVETEDENDESGGFPDGLAAAALAKATRDRPSTRIDPAARSLIDEEVARETQARARESAPLERQEDLGLDTVTGSSKDAAQAARERVVSAIKTGDLPASEGVEAQPEGRFPDVDELNTTLESREPEPEEEPEAAANAPSPAARRARGFRLGFGFMLLVTAVLVLGYAYSPDLAAQFPAQAEVIGSYVALVESLRIWLDSTAAQMVERIAELVGRISQDA